MYTDVLNSQKSNYFLLLSLVKRGKVKPRMIKTIDKTKRKLVRRHKTRRRKGIRSTLCPIVLNQPTNAITKNSSETESLPFQKFVSQNYVTLEDLHKNHFNLSRDRGELIKRKIKVKNLPPHFKGSRPAIVKLKYPNKLLNSFGNASYLGKNHISSRTTGDKRCKYISTMIAD